MREGERVGTFEGARVAMREGERVGVKVRTFQTTVGLEVLGRFGVIAVGGVNGKGLAAHG
jgi:hypothetical protein